MLHQLYVQSGSLYTANGKRKYLTGAERDRFIAAAWACERADLRTLGLTLAYSGARISEVLALTAASIEIEAGFIAFRTLKRRNDAMVIREVPIPGTVLCELATVHALGSIDPETHLWQLSRSRAWTLIRELMARAEVRPGQHATCKGLRHGLGHLAVRRGIALTLLQKWLGHSRLESTCIYAQAMDDEEREIASRLW